MSSLVLRSTRHHLSSLLLELFIQLILLLRFHWRTREHFFSSIALTNSSRHIIVVMIGVDKRVFITSHSSSLDYGRLVSENRLWLGSFFVAPTLVILLVGSSITLQVPRIVNH